MVYRLYSAASLTVRKRKKVKRPTSERVLLQLATTVNEVWSMDFVSDSLSNGRRIRCLAVADDFSHECVSISVDRGISGQYVTRLLGQAAAFSGYPWAVRDESCNPGLPCYEWHGERGQVTSSVRRLREPALNQPRRRRRR